MTRTQRERSANRRSSAWLRRARAHFCGLHRRWAESARSPELYRERVWRLAERLVHHGLLAIRQPHGNAYAVLGCWRRADGMPWWPWRLAEERRVVACMYVGQYHHWLAEKAKRRKRTA